MGWVLLRSNLFDSRLSDRLGMVEEEDRDLLVENLTDVHAAMNPVGRLIPIRLSWPDRESIAFSGVAILDLEGISRQHNRHPMERIGMPGHRLARCEAHSTDQRRLALEESLLAHGRRVTGTNVFIRKNTERFIEEVRCDEPELAEPYGGKASTRRGGPNQDGEAARRWRPEPSISVAYVTN